MTLESLTDQVVAAVKHGHADTGCGVTASELTDRLDDVFYVDLILRSLARDGRLVFTGGRTSPALQLDFPVYEPTDTPDETAS